MNEPAFRKDIIAGFALIIKNWCKGCKQASCKSCLYFEAASQGHIKQIERWATS